MMHIKKMRFFVFSLLIFILSSLTLCFALTACHLNDIPYDTDDEPVLEASYHNNQNQNLPVQVADLPQSGRAGRSPQAKSPVSLRRRFHR